MRDSGPTFQSLEEIGRGGLFVDGDWVESKDQDPSGKVRLTQLADVGVGTWRDRSDRWLREDQARQLRCTFLEPGDVLIARMPEPLGRACLVPGSIGRAITVVDVAILRLRRPDVDRQYVMHMINAPQFQQSVAALQSGTTRKRISRRNLAGLRLPLPALDKQRAIVELLEDHLSRLDAGLGYVATADARASTCVESWLALALAGHESSVLDTLLDAPLANGRSVPTAAQSGFGVLRLTALVDGQIDLTERKVGAWTADEARPFLVAQGDYLVSRGNGGLQRVALGGVVPEVREPVAFPDTMIRIRPRADRVVPEYFGAVWNSRVVRRQIEASARTTAGIYKVNQQQLQQVTLPVPSLAEQRQIASRFADLRATVEIQRRSIWMATRRAQSLRQALLAAAFSGRLTSSTSADMLKEMAGV